MASDHETGGSMSASLVNFLTAIHQMLGRVEAGQTALTIRMDDLRRELTGRMDRIETARTGRRPVDWGRLPWRLIFKACGLLLGGALVLMGHLSVSDLKSLLGLPPVR